MNIDQLKTLLQKAATKGFWSQRNWSHWVSFVNGLCDHNAAEFNRQHLAKLEADWICVDDQGNITA